jgi:hypothetical protein
MLIAAGWRRRLNCQLGCTQMRETKARKKQTFADAKGKEKTVDSSLDLAVKSLFFKFNGRSSNLLVALPLIIKFDMAP